MNNDEQQHIRQTIKEVLELIQKIRNLSEDEHKRLFSLIMNTGSNNWDDK